MMNKELKWKLFLVALIVATLGLSIFKNGLKPGIDLAGGSSLLYEIDITGMSEYERREICEDMIRILRNRIDPSDQMGLVWRAHGVDKIEIQMPLATEETRRLRGVYRDSLVGLESSNISMVKVSEALVHPEGKSQEEYLASRSELFAKLANGNESRLATLNELAAVHDKIEAVNGELATVLDNLTVLETKLTDGGIEIGNVDYLRSRWPALDEPNQAVALAEISKNNPDLEDEIKEHMVVRNQLTKLRASLADEGGLDEQKRDIISKLEKSNLNVDRLEKFLTAAPQRRAAELKGLKEAYPELATKINEVEAAYDAYAGVSGRLDDPEDLKRKLRGSGVLEFRILPSSSQEDLVGRLDGYVNKLAEVGPKSLGTTDYVWCKIRDPKDFRADAIIGHYVEDTYVLASNKPGEVLANKPGEVLGGGDNPWKLKSARPSTNNVGSPAVAFSFNDAGAKLFFELTKNNINRPLCILLDDEAISAPNINSAINGSGIIEGSFTFKETMDLADKLKAGSLPARLSEEPISENNIGPTLGKDNLNAGQRAGIIGLLAVVVFMLIYYRFSGTLADIALALNVVLIVGVMAFTHSTFTMPGIAALILTVGMAVDANVLIFERIREELKGGSSLRIAIKNGYDRAFWTIFDGNLTTFLVALILWVMASEEIKGFALALMIGIVSSMFTALYVTRLIFDILIDANKLTKLNMMHLLDHPSINWIKLRPVFWTVSGVLVIGGIAMFASRQSGANSLYSIEFTGGTSIQFRLNAEKANEWLTTEEQAMDADEIGLRLRTRIEEEIAKAATDPEIKASRVQQVGAPENLEYEVVTSATNLVKVSVTPGEGDIKTVDEVRSAILEYAKTTGDDRLANSEFSESNGTITMVTHQTSINQVKKAFLRVMPNSESSEPEIDNVVGDTILLALGDKLDVVKNLEPSGIQVTPITDDVVSKKPYLSTYKGGLLLTADFAPGKNDTLEMIRKRFEGTRLRSDFEEYDYYDSIFFAPDNTQGEMLVGGVEMVTKDDDVIHGVSDAADWDTFVANEKGRFEKALSLQTSFTRLTQIDPSVGVKAMTEAIIAIVISLLAIIAYIWFRFGNIRFGLAAVVALVHDVSISLGLIAATYALSKTALGRMLLISDFKIDLPVVAAFLTLIGYSLNDTIVVFDRIRENMGKKTVVTSDMINVSINGTLSRTIMTSFTTLIVLFVMYVWGGTGLRPFNFVLLFGIIVGTYSSIAIASPLLVGAVDIEPEDEQAKITDGVPMD